MLATYGTSKQLTAGCDGRTVAVSSYRWSTDYDVSVSRSFIGAARPVRLRGVRGRRGTMPVGDYVIWMRYVQSSSFRQHITGATTGVGLSTCWNCGDGRVELCSVVDGFPLPSRRGQAAPDILYSTEVVKSN